MSGQSTKWREEQILIICPGSQTTMAQLGCNELTPPAYRIPTRMFRDDETDEWRPYRTWKRQKALANGGDAAAQDSEDLVEYVEDPDSDEGAVYPMEAGYITNMEAFLAFLEHVHGLLTATYHNTPIVLMTSPQWTRPDCEAIALYIFEKTRTPALCMINSALATQYGLRSPNLTVVDIGFEKVDVTCIHDSRIVNHMDLGNTAEPDEDRAISGGEVFTQHLVKLLRDQGFTYEMAEQLKKNPICEVLPYAPDHPQLMDLPKNEPSAAETSAAAAAAAAASEAAAVTVDSAGADMDVAMDDGIGAVENEGVLDVASIVTSGQTKEFLAKKEKEKSERGRRRGKDKEADASANRLMRLPNAKRARTQFHYEELVEDDEQVNVAYQGNGTAASAANGTEAAGASTNEKAREEDGEGSEEGSDAEGSDMEDDEEEGEEGPEEAGQEGASSDAAKEKAEAGPSDAEAKPQDAEEAGAGGKAEASTPAKTETAAEDKPSTPEETAKKAADTEAAAAAEAPAVTEDAAMADVPETNDAAAAEAPKTAEEAAAPVEATAATATSTEAVPEAAAAVAAADLQARRFKRLRRDFDIGLERFKFADRAEIDRIVTTIYRTVQGIDDMYMRPACWENLVFVGNGSRLRGLRENIVQTLHARHLVSPSTATMFTSELPSNMGTPSGTGAQTPTGSFSFGGAGAHAVNPLLQAATTASLGGPGAVGALAGGDGHARHFHAQTPTSIKLAPMPTYLAEWTKNGFEEAMFLGAQVAARIAFCVHNLDAQGQESQRLMYLTRVDYNEMGPKGIRTHSLLG